MPIYEYHCSRCHKDFEELIMGGQARVKCPSCGSTKVKRALSVFGMKSGGNGGSVAPSQGGGSACGSCHGGSCSTCK